MLSQLKEKTEIVIRELEASLSEAEKLETKGKLLDKREFEIRDVEKEIDKKIFNFDREQEKFEEEKKAYKVLNEKLTRQQEVLDEDKKSAENLKDYIKELDDKKLELERERKKLEATKKDIDSLVLREKSVIERENLVEKEKLVDRIRKVKLDKREEAILIKERRLALLEE